MSVFNPFVRSGACGRVFHLSFADEKLNSLSSKAQTCVAPKVKIVSTAKTITPPGTQEVLDYKGEISSLRRPSLAA